MNIIPMVGCFFCGVDSRVSLLFFLTFVLSLVGGGLFLLIWAISRGDFKNIESPKYDIIKHANDDI
jgi:hypothetical protein